MPTWDVHFDLRIDVTSPEMVRSNSRAETLSEVNGSLPIPPNVREHFNRLYIHRAVAGTTDIEGADVTEEEVSWILDSETSVLAASRSRAEQEVRNAAAVLTFIEETLRANPTEALTEALVRRIHEMTTQGIDYEHNTPGVYRRHAVTAGTYTPPREHDDIVRLMQEFVQWLHGNFARSLPPMVRAIAAHFYFVSVHPFGDGNGRTARAIESYLLYQAKINPLGFYSLANYYYQQRDRYIAGLEHARFRSGNDLTPFVLFAIRGLASEFEGVTRDVLGSLTVIAYRDHARAELERANKLDSKTGRRMLELVTGLEVPVPLANLRRGRHPLARLYWRLNPKTLQRDVAFLRGLGLVIVDQGELSENLQLMLSGPP